MKRGFASLTLAACLLVLSGGSALPAIGPSTAAAKTSAAKKRAAARKKRAAAKRRAAARRAAARRRAARKREEERRSAAQHAAAPTPTAPATTPQTATPQSSAPSTPPAPSPDAQSAIPQSAIPATPGRPFAASSFWNTPLPDNAPLDPLSSTYTADLQRQLTTWAPWINTTKFSVPVYTVPADQPTVRVKLTVAYPFDLQSAWDRVPLPPDARPADGTDKNLVVWQPSTDTMWEFWQLEKPATGWQARWGGRMTDVSKSEGIYARNWGATATSLPLLGGLIRLDEIRAGHIDHALALAIPQARKDWFSWPAQRTDGNVDSPTAIPAGARLRIDPRLDLSKMRMNPLVRMMAVAAQRYGIVIRDTGGAIVFHAEDPTPTGTNPYEGPGGWYENKYPSQILEGFPWQHLQVLRTDQRR